MIFITDINSYNHEIAKLASLFGIIIFSYLLYKGFKT
jgi:hypothetical protein